MHNLELSHYFPSCISYSSKTPNGELNEWDKLFILSFVLEDIEGKD